jgi:hypothetical protein
MGGMGGMKGMGGIDSLFADVAAAVDAGVAAKEGSIDDTEEDSTDTAADNTATTTAGADAASPDSSSNPFLHKSQVNLVGAGEGAVSTRGGAHDSIADRQPYGSVGGRAGKQSIVQTSSLLTPEQSKERLKARQEAGWVPEESRLLRELATSLGWSAQLRAKAAHGHGEVHGLLHELPLRRMEFGHWVDAQNKLINQELASADRFERKESRGRGMSMEGGEEGVLDRDAGRGGVRSHEMSGSMKGMKVSSRGTLTVQEQLSQSGGGIGVSIGSKGASSRGGASPSIVGSRGGDAERVKHSLGRVSVLQVQYTTHHTPYTIHHTPYTTHHTPHTMHHTPYTIYHIPYTMHHALCTMHHAPYTIHHTPYTILIM